MGRYKLHYENQSGGGAIGPVYRASFGVPKFNGIGSFFWGQFQFVKLFLYSGAKSVGKEALNRFQYNNR